MNIKYFLVLVTISFIISSVFIVLFSCKSSNTNVNIEYNLVTEQGLLSIEIPVTGFWQLQPWRNGTLVAIDKEARFSEISFVGANRIRMSAIADFPRAYTNENLTTWPNEGLIINEGYGIFNIFSIDDGINRRFDTGELIHRMRNAYSKHILLDSKQGLIAFNYYSQYMGKSPYAIKTYIYNYKEDAIVYENEENSVLLYMAIDDQNVIGRIIKSDSSSNSVEKFILYNWRNQTIVENNLTNILNEYNFDFYARNHINISVDKRYLFGEIRGDEIRRDERHIMVTWNEDYSNVTIFNLSNLEPGKLFHHRIDISPCGEWVSVLILFPRRTPIETPWGIRYYEYRRAFFHINNKYPNGISKPIYTAYYSDDLLIARAFIDHPMHGICFAEESYIMERRKKKQFINLFRMSDVLNVIDKNNNMGDN